VLRSRSSASPLLVVLAALLAGCASYVPLAARRPDQMRCEAPVPATPLAFEQALVRMVEHNPELKALRARAAAVVLRPDENTVTGMLELADGGIDEFLVGTDVLALFGVGVKPARAALARAVRHEALAAHHERARVLAGELAEAYAADRELVDLATYVEALGVERFRRAGLAATADEREARSSAVGWESERRIVELERSSHRRRVAELLGLDPAGEVSLFLPTPGWPARPDTRDDALFHARADLQRLAAAVETADRDYRVALAKQIPTLGLALGARYDPTEPLQVIELSLPLGARAEARGAHRAREAALHELRAGVLAARHEAREAVLELERADADLRFAEEWWRAKRALVKAARERTAADANELAMALHLEGEEIEAARDLREARVARAVARVRAALAAGWPGPVPGAPGRPVVPQAKEVEHERPVKRHSVPFGSG
jgi:hypothetical protein